MSTMELSTVEQSRKLVTAIPGPVSTQLGKRRVAAVSRGVGVTMPVFVARAAGGIIEDGGVYTGVPTSLLTFATIPTTVGTVTFTLGGFNDVLDFIQPW